MDIFKQECKLCDNIIHDGNFKVIEDPTKTIFDRLLLKLTLDNDTQNVICAMCSSKLLAASDFKTTCVDTDDTLFPYINFENPKPVDLKEIYAKEKGGQQDGSMLDDVEVCRLCLRPTNNDHKSIQEVPVDSIQIYIPEINLSKTANPVVCIKCHDALCVHSSFIKNCLEVERKRNMMATDVENILLTSIKEEEIEIKPEPVDYVTFSEVICNIKKEEEEEKEGDSSIHSQNGLMDTAETRNPSEVQKYTCDKCDYESIHKRNLRRHELIHKEPSEVRMYMCDVCDYKSFRIASFKIHQLVHKDPSEVQKFECDQCDYKSFWKANLKIHKLRHKDPSQEKMYTCDRCDYKNMNKANLRRHQTVHKDPSEKRMYTCDKCDYKNADKRSVRRHQIKHENYPEMRAFSCDKCSYKSFWVDDPETPQWNHHQCDYKDTDNKASFHSRNGSTDSVATENPSEVELYMCDRCDYKSTKKRNLRRHQLVHRDPSEKRVFKCEECDYESFQRSYFKIHQLKHKDPSEVQLYSCDQCDYKNISKHNLRRHQVRHQVRMYECGECDYKSLKKADFMKHQLNHRDAVAARHNTS